MAQTLTRLLVHLIFSTKNREPLILEEFESDLFGYIGGICRNHASPALAINGTEDHVHIAISLSKNAAIAPLVMAIKRDSSRLMHTRVPEFGWQDGYAAFSVGESGLEELLRYIRDQKEHHRHRSFKDELVAFLKKYNVEYDERFLWT